MATITTRAGKGSPLTNAEVDANFTNLNAELITKQAALGFTPYNATNPAGYITSSALSPYLTTATAASTYQPVDGDLTAIGALAGTSGILRKTAANTWSLDTATYLTGITSGQVTTALGFTPYNATNPSGYITSSALTPYLTSATAASTYQPIGSYLTGINSSQVTTALGFTPANKAGDTFTGNVFVNAGTDSRTLLQVSGVTQAQLQATASAIRLASNNTTPLVLSTNGVDRVTFDSAGNITFGATGASGVFKVQGNNVGDLVVFESTDAAASAAPDVVLYRNSATPAAADQVGNFVFRGKNSAAADTNYARILSTIIDPASGVEVGDLRFGVKTASGFNDLMTLTATGLSVTGAVSATTLSGNGSAITSLTSGQITTALGFTPYNATNPSGYTSNTGTVTSVGGTGTVSGLTLTGTVTTSGNLTLGGTLSLTSGQVTTALGFTPYSATNPNGYTTNTGTVTSVGGTGTVSGLTLTGTVTGSGNLTLGGTLSLTSGQVTSALGFTPYNSTNPSGYITSSALSSYLPLTGGTMTGSITFAGSQTFPNAGISTGKAIAMAIVFG
jgi:hypothetical protein